MVATSPPQARQPRDPFIELARIFSAFGIVWYHSKYPPGHFVAYAGLIFFIAISIYFEASRKRAPSYLDTARRLLVPWLFWTAIYSLADLAQRQPVFDPPLPRWLLIGASTHLWYLPFMFLATIAVRSLRRFLPIPAVIGMVTLILTAGIWYDVSGHFGVPFSQWAYAFPAVLFGVILAQRGRLWVVLAGLCLVALLTSLKVIGFGPSYLIGCAVALLVVVQSRARPQPSAFRGYAALLHLSQLMLGVYLIHPIFLSLGGRVHLGGLALVLFAFFGALAVTAAIRLTRPGRIVT